MFIKIDLFSEDHTMFRTGSFNYNYSTAGLKFLNVSCLFQEGKTSLNIILLLPQAPLKLELIIKSLLS